MRIGLFGDTFNPIHRCHVVAATQTQRRLRLDRILFIPSGDPPHKKTSSLAPAHHRYEMVQIAIQAIPAFAITDVEMRRPSKSYSIETVQKLQQQFGPDAELFFIIGLDAFLELHTWKQASDLLRACHFVVLARPGSTFTSLLKMPVLPSLDRAPLAALDTHRALQVDVPLPGGMSLILLSIPPCSVSASDIRYRVAHRLNVSNLLPEGVESYILDQHLYQPEEKANRTGI